MKQNIGFIGFGNMAQAMADGMLASGIVKGEQLYACARQWDKLCRNTEVRGMHACKHAIDMVRQCDIILLAVKPAQMSEAISTVKEHLQGKAVVSIAAGMFFETYEQLLPPHTQHLSVIPNMPVSVCEGVMLWEQRNSLQTEAYGLGREAAYRLCAQMMAGTAKQLLVHPQHPGQLKDRVSSPKGTTIQGVAELERLGFRNALISAIERIEQFRLK